MGQQNNYIVSVGHCRHLGATIEKDGVNFAVWAPDAAEIDFYSKMSMTMNLL